MKKTSSLLLAFMALICCLLLKTEAAAVGESANPALNACFEGLSRIQRTQAGRVQYGYADEAGRVVISCQFDEAFPFKGGVACVGVGDHWGFINQAGKYITKNTYTFIGIAETSRYPEWPYQPEAVSYFEDGPRIVAGELGRVFGLLAEDGTELLAPIYTAVFRLDGGCFQVLDGNHAFVVDARGKRVGPSGYSTVLAGQGADFWIVGNGRKQGLATGSGQLLAPLAYDEITTFSKTGYAMRQGEKWGFMGGDGTVMTAPEYDEITHALGGFGMVRKGVLWGVVDAQGRLVCPIEYETVAEIIPGQPLFCVRQQGHYGVMTSAGELVIPCAYDWISGYNRRLLQANKQGAFGFYDTEGRQILPVIYQDIAGPVDGVFAVQTNGQWSLLNEAGEKTPLLYERIVDAGEGLFEVLLNGKCGCIDSRGTVRIPMEYEGVRFDACGVARVRKNNRAGGILPDGSVLIPFDYTYIEAFDGNGRARASQDGKLVTITLPADTPSPWAASYLDTAVSQWLVPNSLNSGYRQSITRQEFCALVANDLRMRGYRQEAFGGDAVAFTDSNDADVLMLANLGIVNGVGNRHFNPDGLITREHSAILLANYMRYLGFADNVCQTDYTDRAAISSGAADSVDYVTAFGVMTGVGENRFDARGHYTREQAITTVVRIFQQLGR